MTNPIDRRRFRRVELKLPATVHVKLDDNRIQAYEAEVLDISEGGMKLRTHEPIASVGQELAIHVRFGAGLLIKAKVRESDEVEHELSEEELGESVVRWADGVAGTFGVEFLGLHADKRKLLRDLVESLRGDDGTVAGR